MGIPLEPFWIKGNWAGKLAIVKRPRGGDWLLNDILDLRHAGFDLIVSLLCEPETIELGLKEEAKLAKNYGMSFLSFPIEDYGVPASTGATARLVNSLHHLLNEGKSVAIHCRQSVGRSSLIAACELILAGNDVQAALDRVQNARGVPVPDTIEQRQWVERFADQTFNYTMIR